MSTTLFSQNPKEHVGKTVSRISTDTELEPYDLSTCDRVEIHFTDGTSLILRTDWRGRECYISQVV